MDVNNVMNDSNVMNEINDNNDSNVNNAPQKPRKTMTYNILSENNTSTVVAHYERQAMVEDSAYQTEADLERSLIEQLQRQGYEYAQIHNEDELIDNLRQKLEELNGYRFTDSEWRRFFKTEIAAEGKGIVDKTRTIQTDFVKTLRRDNGEEKNIYLIKKDDVHANRTQVINQYEVWNGQRPNRYDVSILVNGLPLVHIELKKRGVSIKEAFNQINRYGRESFWAGNGLFVKKFKKYYIFGFTGTPIFAENVTGSRGNLRTTDDVFGRRLHTYTIVDAIRDHNVLPFRVTYVSTMKSKKSIVNRAMMS